MEAQRVGDLYLSDVTGWTRTFFVRDVLLSQDRMKFVKSDHKQNEKLLLCGDLKKKFFYSGAMEFLSYKCSYLRFHDR